MDLLDPDDLSTEDTEDYSDSSSCSRHHGHVHRQDRQKVYDFSEDEIDNDDDDEQLEPRDVKINKDQRVDAVYDLLEILGKGKFGVVHRCMEKSTSTYFAAKFIDIKHQHERKEVETEIELMNDLRHRRLLQLHDAFEDGKRMVIIMELATGGELFNRVIDEQFVLTEKVCTVFMRQICEGVEYMHSRNVVHLDLKPENVLCVTPTGNRIKLIDFGLARRCSAKDNIRVMFGTPEFVAPEVINYDRISLATDMCLSGLSPFMGDNDVETLSNVTNAAWDFEDECFDAISEDGKDFITQLLVKRPEKRITATQSLKHKWLKQSRRRPSILDPEDKSLSKAKLRRFVIRRRWQKVFNTIRALRRMGSFRLDSCASPTSPGPGDKIKPIDLVLSAGGVPDDVTQGSTVVRSDTEPDLSSVSEEAEDEMKYNNDATKDLGTGPIDSQQSDELVVPEEVSLADSMTDRETNGKEGHSRSATPILNSPTDSPARSAVLTNGLPPTPNSSRASSHEKSATPEKKSWVRRGSSSASSSASLTISSTNDEIPEGKLSKTGSPVATKSPSRSSSEAKEPAPSEDDKSESNSVKSNGSTKSEPKQPRYSPSPKKSPTPEYQKQNSLQFQDSRKKFEEAGNRSSFSKSPSPAAGGPGTFRHSMSTSSFSMEKSASPDTRVVTTTTEAVTSQRTVSRSSSVSKSSSPSPAMLRASPTGFQKSPSPIGSRTPPSFSGQSSIADVIVPIQIIQEEDESPQQRTPGDTEMKARPRSMVDSGAEDLLDPTSTPSTPDILDDDDSETSGGDEGIPLDAAENSVSNNPVSSEDRTEVNYRGERTIPIQIL